MPASQSPSEGWTQRCLQGTQPSLQIQPKASARLDQCAQREGECFYLWELFPIQNFFLMLVPGTGSSNGSPKHWHDLLGTLSLCVVSCHCQATTCFQTALVPSPPCPPSPEFQPGPPSEGCHTGAPSSSSPTGFWRRWPLLLKLHIQKMYKTLPIFHMSLELKSLACAIARSRWHILLLQIGFKVRCI